MNPRAATNDLLPFQGSPFNHLGTSAWLIHDGYLFSKASHCVCLNGESGIRTHAPFRTNGFQDRLVMTASISLQTCFSILQDKKRFVKSFLFIFSCFFLIFLLFISSSIIVSCLSKYVNTFLCFFQNFLDKLFGPIFRPVFRPLKEPGQ